MPCQSQIAEVTRHFDQASQAWHDVYHNDQTDGYALRTRLSRALDLVQRHGLPGGRVLDLGCGCGPASLELARRGHEIVGLDVSPAMIANANKRADEARLADRCRFECADIAAIELDAHSFDIIVALGFIEYFDEPTTMLTRMRQWLKPDGVLVLQISNRLRLTNFLERRTGERLRRNGAGLLTRQYTPGEIAQAAAACGLGRIDYRGHSIGPLKIGHRYLPGFRAAIWLERRMDEIADVPAFRALGRLGTSVISVFRPTTS